MKIPNGSQIKACDAFTIAHEPISSLALMERAAQKCADYLSNRFSAEVAMAIFCGKGNNGGDGLAIARLLYFKGYNVKVFYESAGSFSEDARANFHRLKEISGVELLDFKAAEGYQFQEKDIIVDALFGSGLNQPLIEPFTALISYLNSLPNYRISIDIPSGLYTDKISESVVFNADETLSLQFWKRAFLHPETGSHCGKIIVLDIGLLPDCLPDGSYTNHSVDEEIAKNIYRPRRAFSHKGSYGKAALFAGSYGKIGAAVLATQAAVRTGSGLTYILAPDCGYDILQSKVPEAMFVCSGENKAENFFVPENAVVGIGPGLGTDPKTESALQKLLEDLQLPSVVDADALNLVAKDINLLEKLPKNSILTPHPKEFERLFGKTADSFERLEKAKNISTEKQLIIILKDRFTQTVLPDGRVFYNTSGNAGLAKGGSGDALTGILTALLAQGYPPEEAAVFGVWLHGRAADIAVRSIAQESLTASDVIEYISNVYLELQ